MTSVAAPAARRGAPARAGAGRLRWSRVVENGALALLAYVPFLLSSPGKVSADNKSILYINPGGLLSRALYLWDPHLGMGTVPHQQIGFLFPIGPFYWVLEKAGMPSWVAQRIWLGTISLAAVIGARWLFEMLGARRAGALAGALVYMLTPYQLAFTARISALLLPWAALPWLIGLTIRAVRRGGWTDAAWFALIILLVGSINATSLLLAGLGPVLWVIMEMCRGRAQARAALLATARIGVLTIGVSVWWAVGLRLQGAYGLPVLQLTENLRTVASSSTPLDLLRGLGNWFFYGQDRIGYTVDQASYYVVNNLVIVASFAVPVAALLAAAVMRWRHRAFFVVLVVVGTVVGAGSWPYDNPSIYGRVWKAFANNSSLGLALRNSPRVGPVIVLGVAGLLAGGVSALAGRRLEVVAAIGVGALAFAALVPVWKIGYFSQGTNEPESIPQYWRDAAAAMSADGNSTRILEIPGSNFADYRWGDTVDPVTPMLTNRPYVAREVLPSGSAQSVNLLDALDQRIQEGTFEPSSLAAVARLMNVGTISLRSDLQFERFALPRPQLLWNQLTEPQPKGLDAPKGFGAPVPNIPSPAIATRDELAMTIPPNAPNPPPVALFEVQNPVPIVHTAPTEGPVVLSGDGNGIVDAAAAGLLDGNQLVLEMASLSTAQLQQALHDGADLVMTDSNRKRTEDFFSSLRDTTGPTERAGQSSADTDTNFVLDVFPGSTDADRTVVEQHGGTADATSTVPQDRPLHAFDGDLRTAWRAPGANPTGATLTLHPAKPVRADHVTLIQPQTGVRDRYVTKAKLTFDTGKSVTVDLGPDSRTPEGQVVPFPARTIRRLSVEILATNHPPIDPKFANPVGFAEVELGDVKLSETVRLPVDVADKVGSQANGHRLDVVLSRLRYDPTARDRQDEELALARRFVLPDARTFGLTGTARVNPNAPDDVLDSVLGTTAPGVTYTSSGHLTGNAEDRASRAFDGDPSTLWSAPVAKPQGQWVQVNLPAPITVDHANLVFGVNGRQDVPTRLTLVADGKPVQALTVPDFPNSAIQNNTYSVTIPFAPVTAKSLRLVIDDVRDVTNSIDPNVTNVTLPPAIAEVGFAGVPQPAPAPAQIDTGCRDDLLRVDGQAVPVQIAGPAADARNGLPITPCGGAALSLPKGSNTLASTAGLSTGIDLDRVVLSSDPAGAPAPVQPIGTPLDQSGATTTKVVNSSPTKYQVTVHTDGKPFWLVLGQSNDAGWKAVPSSGTVGPNTNVSGYANGWLVRPARAGTMTVSITWTPQRLVWIGFGISAVAVIACLVILVFAWRRRRRRRAPPADAAAAVAPVDAPDPAPAWAIEADEPALVSPFAYAPGVPPGWGASVAAAIGVGVGVALVSRPWIGVIAGVGMLLAMRFTHTRAVLSLGAPVVLVMARVVNAPEVAWLALGLVAADVVCGTVRARHAPSARDGVPEEELARRP
jgi:hypothetical protein